MVAFTRRQSFLLASLAGCLMLAGCGGGKPKNEGLLRFISERSARNNLPIKFEQVELGETQTTGEPPRATAKIKAVGILLTDILAPVEEGEIWKHFQYDPKPFEEAVAKAGKLRDPERSTVGPKPSAAGKLPTFYAKIRSAGEQIECIGTATAVQTADGWQYVDFQGKFPDDMMNPRLVSREQLKPGMFELGVGADNPVGKLIGEQQDYVKAVTSAEAAMAARLKLEQQQLFDASRPGAAWTTTLRAASGPPVKVQLSFVESSEDAAKLALVCFDVDDPLARSVWLGGLELPPPNERAATVDGARRSGWQLTFVPAEKSEVFPPRIGQITLGPGKDGALVWESLSDAPTLAAAKDGLKLPTLEELATKIKTWTTPGQVWEGTYQVRSEASKRVRLTITEYRDDGQLIRAVLEPSEDPHLTAVYEGTASTAVDRAFGQPIQLTQKSVYGGRDFGLKVLKLSPNFGAKTDEVLAPGMKLALQTPIADFKPLRQTWADALTPGKRWKGKITYRDGKSDAFVWTTAEVRDDLAYVRVIAEGATNTAQHRIFEGFVSPDEATDDGYGLIVQGKTITRNHPPGIITEWWSAFFGVRNGEESVHRFRVLPDGKSIVGLSNVGERIVLTPDEVAAPLPTDRASFAATWRERCVVGSRWRGMLNNWAANQKAEVEVEIVALNPQLDEITVAAYLPERPSAKIMFTGTFRPDNDVNVNAYAIQLRKQTAGAGDSIVFGKPTEVFLHFRLNADGTALLGVARGDWGSHHAWNEILELNRVIPMEKKEEKKDEAKGK